MKMSRDRQNISPELRLKLSLSAKAKIFTKEHRENIAKSKALNKLRRLEKIKNGSLV
jgi:hypothetical protein